MMGGAELSLEALLAIQRENMAVVAVSMGKCTRSLKALHRWECSGGFAVRVMSCRNQQLRNQWLDSRLMLANDANSTQLLWLDAGPLPRFQ